MSESKRKLAYDGAVYEVYYDYQPEEQGDNEWDGCEASADLNRVECGGYDLTEALNGQTLEALEDKCLELHTP